MPRSPIPDRTDQVFIVVRDDDNGTNANPLHGSLRWAIAQASADFARDVIEFHFTDTPSVACS